MSPLFCMIDNPLALSYFASEGQRTFALGPDATPGQVVSALTADYKHAGTVPILCSVYQLAAWRNHWSFAVSPVAQISATLGFPADWCTDPGLSAGP